ncbi:hypothetical protein ACP70R_022994 [Stipagrostis hirtigluma subsp. patula]
MAVGEFRRRLRVADVKGGRTRALRGWGRTSPRAGGCAPAAPRGPSSSSRVNDGSCLSNMQCVLTPDTDGYDQIDYVTTGASVLVEGVVASSQGCKQKVVLKVSKITVDRLGKVTPHLSYTEEAGIKRIPENCSPSPFSDKHFWCARVRNALAYATHKFFQDKWICLGIKPYYHCLRL